MVESMIIKSNYIDYSNNISLAGGIDLSTGKEFYSIYARINTNPITRYYTDSKQAFNEYNEMEKQLKKDIKR